MLRPFRLIMLATLALLVYVGFFQVPASNRDPAAFDPSRVAAHEIDAWKAARAHEEFGAFFAHVAQMRELNRLSWFRAAQTGLAMARSSTTFVDLRGRYERVLPHLEEVAAVEKGWRGGSFEPAEVARADLDWMVAARVPSLSDLDSIAGYMAQSYGLRYGMRADQMFAAATARGQAFKLMFSSDVDPDWKGIQAQLEQSYMLLRQTLSLKRP